MEQVQREQRRRDTRRILWQWGDTLAYCRRKQSEIRLLTRLIADASDTLSAQQLDSMPHSPNISTDGVYRAMEAMQRNRDSFETARQQATAAIDRALSLKTAIDALIDDLPAIQQRVLHAHYEDGHKYEFIALSLCYDARQIQRFESAAVDTLTNSINMS